MKKFSYIDLFAGAGGLSEGFIANDFEHVAHIEKNTEACQTIKTRLSYHHLKEEGNLDFYNSYLKKEISQSDFYSKIPSEILNSVICKEMHLDDFETLCTQINASIVDVIIGGPPCQAYSIVGRARQRDTEKKETDPRLFLYKIYGEFLKKFKPKLFVFENVPGILSAKTVEGEKFIENIKAEFQALDYEMDFQTLNSAEFGVLQNRHRVIIIGWQKHLNLSYPDFSELKKSISEYTINNDLFADLPKIQSSEKWDSVEYAAPPTDYLRQSGLRTEKDLLTWHIARMNNENDKEIYRLVHNEWFNKGKRTIYKNLPSHLIKQKNIKSFQNRFCVVEGDKSASHTVVAHIAQDGHYYIHPDLEQNRSITVREAARLQSFPDNFYFEGSRTSAFSQIGNAVPPLFASAIAKAIKNILCQINKK